MTREYAPTPGELCSIAPQDGRVSGRAVLWRFDRPHMAISSTAIADGVTPLNWIALVEVPVLPGSTDVVADMSQLTTELELAGAGNLLLTAADVTNQQTREVAGVRADATLEIAEHVAGGAIIIVVQVPVAFAAGGALSAAITAIEAKTQALIEADLVDLGSPSDMVIIAWPADAPLERFGGARSEWGARVAKATHAVVAAGAKVPGSADS